MNAMTNLRACVLFALLFGLCYGGAAWWTATLPGPLPSWDFAFEQRVPFVPWLSIIYLTITPVLLLAPLLLRDRTPMFAFALSVQTVVATFFFVLFPLQNAWARPEVDHWPFRLADAMNLAYNEFPSLHVAFAVSAAWAYRRVAWALWAAAVAVSAWLMWEHHLVEIVAGVALAMIVMRVAERESTWVELCCLVQCAKFSRRHLRYFVIFLAIYGPSLLHWRRYRAVRTGFCAAQWIDDLLDGDRPSQREPLEIVDELLDGMSLREGAPRNRWSGRLRGRRLLATPRVPGQSPGLNWAARLRAPRVGRHRDRAGWRSAARRPVPLSRLTRAFFAEVTADARRDFIALVHCMRVDRVRVIRHERWTAERLDEHHRRTFTLSVNLMLHTAGCAARAEQVPSLIDALAWCSVFRDLEEDLRKGLDNIPRGADVKDWTRESHARACAALERSAREIAALDDPRARGLLGIFQRSIEKFARRDSGATTARAFLRMPQPQSTADLPPHLRPVDPPAPQPERLPLEDIPPPPSPFADDSRAPDPFLRRT